MTRTELIKLLCENRIPKDLFDFEEGHGYLDDQYLLKKDGIKWSIYYLERGMKVLLKSFFSEEKANEYFYKILLETITDGNGSNL